MPLLAVGLYFDFLLLVIGWRAYRSYRLTGDHGLRLFRPETSTANFVAVWLIVISGTLYSMAAPLIRRDWISMYEFPSRDVRFGLAAALMLTGVATTVVAQLQMGGSWRIGIDPRETTSLVTGGLFRSSRNPIYVGVATFWLGNFFLMPNLLSGFALVLGWLGLQILVRLVEEPFMRTKHGEAYRIYESRTSRFLPGLSCSRIRPSRVVGILNDE